MYFLRCLLLFLLLTSIKAFGQQDMDLHLNGTFLAGKNILKVKRDFHDPYLWVLAQNNEVYRINSITKVVDDYTSQFSAYNSFQFVDIAGRSQDTVFIATNSTNVIEYKKGVFKVIGAADGIAGVVNSIGIDASGRYNSFINNNYIAIIATSNGLCRYNYQTETMVPVPANASSRIFEMTYRTEMLHDSEFCRCYADTVVHYPAFDLVTYTIFGGELWLGGNSFGNNLRSAFYTSGGAYDPNNQFVVYADQFWATETGLFQNYWDYSYTSYSGFGYRHYLHGVNISKITSIYGLLSFGSNNDNGLAKENLLIGSSQGLYFSNSKYRGGPIATYSFFHADELGNKAINDICVNANSYATTNMANICEDGIWIAATDGLYLMNPNYAPYLNTAQQIQAIEFNGQAFNVSKLQVCNNTSVQAEISNTGYSSNVVQWYKDGQPLTGQTATTLNISATGDYYAVLYDPCSPIYFSSNHLTVTVISAPVFSFNYADVMNYCDGSTATLNTDNNAAYQYRWYKDGVLNGNTTAALNTTVAGKYKVEVSACQGNSWTASKEVQVNFIKVPQPVITTDKASYCIGDKATLTATVPIDASQIINWTQYQYRWYKDGVLNHSTTAAITVSQNGKYKVEVTSCSGTWIASVETSISFTQTVAPTLSGDKTAYCIGDQATLSLNFNADPTETIVWNFNGTVLSANQNKTSLTTTQPGTYTAFITSSLTTCTVASSTYTLSFSAMPTISIQQIVNTNLCDGQPVNLKASYSAGSIKWSTGGTADEITVDHSGTYQATVTTAAGCTVQGSTSVQFLSNPVLTVPNATLCQFTNETITLTAPTGFAKYEWNGVQGNYTYTTGKLGSVSLTVTDSHGCQATQTITISSHCKDIHIPNTFTPNGDGINDSWVISGLENDLSTTVKVYNRTGEQVFQSQGYATAWNGTYNGKKLPTGEYYYVISARDAKQVLSGSVTILY